MPIEEAVPRLIVEGWRFLPHSYAIVNQWQLLALRRRHIALKVVDIPYYRASWQPQTGLFDPAEERLLHALPQATPDEWAEARLRMVAPFSFAPARADRTAIFATLEQQAIQPHQIADAAEYQALRRAPPPPEVVAVTPSRWSAEGFHRAGFRPEQILVVPHGVEATLFRPMPDARRRLRDSLGIADDEFAFLSIGAMSGNKGIDLLLQAFAEVCLRQPRTRLVLKGSDQLYRSQELVQRGLQGIAGAHRAAVAERLVYTGAAMSMREMAEFYSLADAYVSPYRAEGFNLPVLEAAACGLPILCTGGGATDDFVTDDFALRIGSRKQAAATDGSGAMRLEPDLGHLVELMLWCLEAAEWRLRAALAGPRHVAAQFGWDHVAERLIRHLLP